MSNALTALTDILGEVADLQRASELIEWDERVYMPPGGAASHGEMTATLRKVAHEKFTSTEVERLIENASSDVGGADPDSDDARLVAVAARDFRKAVQVPGEYVARHARIVSAAQVAWATARQASNFNLFAPHLERIVDLKREYAGFFSGAAHPYDHLLDDYEPDLTTTEVRVLFDGLRRRQVALLQAIQARPQVDDAVVRASFSEKDLWDFSVEVMTAFGFDWTRGRQDKSAHPFCSSVGPDDVRVTTRWVPTMPLALVTGTMHETGHALYEQGISPDYSRSLLRGGASLGVHESQSRLWEKFVGQSEAFWSHFLPSLQRRCPQQLGSVSLPVFYKAINKVEPSLIRVEADEATYNLHVMLRVEMEIALLDGTVAVSDAPAVWNQKMQEYLGITPPDDASGVLQDIHWSAGLFGYFATYTLGNVLAAQLWARFEAVHPQRDAEIRAGNFSHLLAWLRNVLHQSGRKFTPRELILRAVGSGLDAEPYLQYLESKYRTIYGIG